MRKKEISAKKAKITPKKKGQTDQKELKEIYCDRFSLYVIKEDWEVFERIALKAREENKDLTIPEFIARNLEKFGSAAEIRKFNQKRHKKITLKYGTTVKTGHLIDFKLLPPEGRHLNNLATKMKTTKANVIRYLINSVNEKEGMVELSGEKPEPGRKKRFDIKLPEGFHEALWLYASDEQIKISKLFRMYFDDFKDEDFKKYHIPVSRGRFVDQRKFKNIDKDPRGPWVAYSLKGNSTKKSRPDLHYDIINIVTGAVYPCPATGWKFPSETVEEFIYDGIIIWPKRKGGRLSFKAFYEYEGQIYREDLIHVSITIYQDMFEKVKAMAKRLQVSNTDIVRAIVIFIVRKKLVRRK